MRMRQHIATDRVLARERGGVRDASAYAGMDMDMDMVMGRRTRRWSHVPHTAHTCPLCRFFFSAGPLTAMISSLASCATARDRRRASVGTRKHEHLRAVVTRACACVHMRVRMSVLSTPTCLEGGAASCSTM